MFSTIAGNGRLQSATGEPVVGLLINVEMFFVKNKQWAPITEFQTGRGGDFKFSARASGFEEVPAAPQLRLVEQRQKSVLPAVPGLRLVRRTLTANYGTVQLPGEGGNSAEMKELKQALERSNKVIDELQAKLAQAEVDGVATEEIKRLKLQLVAKNVELTAANTKLGIAEAGVMELTGERDTLTLELEQIRNADTASPLITDLAGSVAKSLGDATKSEAARGFKLADAQVTLKGYLADGGARFKPLDAAELVRANAAGASEISFRLAPTADAENAGSKMPDLVGLTPASARRIIRPLGQAMQVVEAAGKPAGAIIRQVPKAGAALDPDTTIRLVVAVGEGEE